MGNSTDNNGDYDVLSIYEELEEHDLVVFRGLCANAYESHKSYVIIELNNGATLDNDKGNELEAILREYDGVDIMVETYNG